jgi:hypothetical protein
MPSIDKVKAALKADIEKWHEENNTFPVEVTFNAHDIFQVLSAAMDDVRDALPGAPETTIGMVMSRIYDAMLAKDPSVPVSDMYRFPFLHAINEWTTVNHGNPDDFLESGTTLTLRVSTFDSLRATIMAGFTLPVGVSFERLMHMKAVRPEAFNAKEVQLAVKALSSPVWITMYETLVPPQFRMTHEQVMAKYQEAQ